MKEVLRDCACADGLMCAVVSGILTRVLLKRGSVKVNYGGALLQNKLRMRSHVIMRVLATSTVV